MRAMPDNFREHYSALTNLHEFEQCLGKPLRKSIRINTLKTSVEALLKRLREEWVLAQIPWMQNGFFIEHKKGERNDIGNILGHNEGLFYIQEAASMIPALVLESKPGELVLDMCASPGGKTTQMAEIMQNRGKIVAADVRDDRIAILKRNVARMGVTNCEIVKRPGQQFKNELFDRILVDAPCSGTGTMRLQEDVANWNPEIAGRMSFEQKSLLESAFKILKKSGVIVYSTCSLEPEENEEVIDWLLRKHKKAELEEIAVKGLKSSKPVLEYGERRLDERISRCIRIWPQDNDSSGFFVAKIVKRK